MRLRPRFAQIKVVVSMINLELLYNPAVINRNDLDGRLVVVSIVCLCHYPRRFPWPVGLRWR